MLLSQVIAALHWGELLIGAAFGAGVAIAVSYVFYVLQAHRAAPSLAFLSSSSAVVTRSEQEVGDLEVRFHGVVVPRLTRTRMALWNPRWAIVEGADIADTDPLRIRVRDGEVIDARVVTQTRDAAGFSVEVREGACFWGSSSSTVTTVRSWSCCTPRA